MGSVNVKKGVDRALFPALLTIGTVVDIYLGCKKDERPYPRNLQNGFNRLDFHDTTT